MSLGPRVGVYPEGSTLTAVLLRGRGSVEHLAADGDEASAALATWAAGHRLRRARVGLARESLIVKAIELPTAAGRSLDQVLRYEIERHVPFAGDEIAFGWAPLPSAANGPTRVLIAAIDRRAVDALAAQLTRARLRARSIAPACHDLPALLDRRQLRRRAAWVHGHGAYVDVVFLAGPQVRLSRSLPALGAAELAGQIADSLGVLRWRDVEAVWISGDAAEPLLGAPELAGMARDVGLPPLARDVEPLAEQLTIELGGKGLLALATALGARQPALDLLPPALRPLVLTPRHAVTGGLGAAAAALLLAALLLHGHRDARYLERLDQATRALDGEARAVDALGNELGGARRLLASLRTIEGSGLKPLPLLRELTEVLPADAWLGSLSVDPRGLELSGQANAASQLIPVLESSPWLERVEFTSPVVRGRDKEQFRLRATWESGPGGPPEAAPASAPAVTPGPAAPAAPRTPAPATPTPPRRPDPRRSG